MTLAARVRRTDAPADPVQAVCPADAAAAAVGAAAAAAGVA